MDLLVVPIIVAMILFASVSAFREVLIYQQALKGELQYLVSKRRLTRRLLISAVLIAEAVLLSCGFFLLPPGQSASQALLFWMVPLLLIVALVYLSLQDFHETSRDIDRIFKEAKQTAAEVIEKRKDPGL